MKREKRTFGRPKNMPLENQFMRSLRGDKLQVIIACSELELILIEMDYGSAQEQEEEEVEYESQIVVPLASKEELLVLEVPNLTQEIKERLNFFVQEAKKKWQEPTLEGKDRIPKFLFEGPSDLSFIFHSLIENFNFSELKAPQLLYIYFLVLQDDKKMSHQAFDYFKENIDFMIKGTIAGLQKASQKQKQKLIKKQKEQDKAKIPKNPRKGSFEEIYDVLSNTPQKNNKPICKSKSLKQKKNKRGKKRGKIMEKNEVSSEEGIDLSEQLQYPEGLKLATAVCNYIVWAYWYILQK